MDSICLISNSSHFTVELRTLPPQVKGHVPVKISAKEAELTSDLWTVSSNTSNFLQNWNQLSSYLHFLRFYRIIKCFGTFCLILVWFFYPSTPSLWPSSMCFIYLGSHTLCGTPFWHHHAICYICTGCGSECSLRRVRVHGVKSITL